MAAVPELDLAAILAPISGDAPGGSRMPFLTRQKLEAMRKDSEPNPDDPSGADIPKKPDWTGIIRLCSETLAKTSKDLETAMRLLEALTRQAGFPGATRGFEVLKQLVENCWDFLHPIPDPEDGEGPEIRKDRFNWIGDKDAGARYPNTLKQVPFLTVAGQLYSMQDRAEAMENRGPISSDEMSRAILADGAADEFAACRQSFLALDEALIEKLGRQNAPEFVGLHRAFEELQEICTRLAAPVASDEAAVSNGDGSAPASGGGGGIPGSFSINTAGIASREEAYRLIGQIADQLSRLEPHSPIPDLLHRAIELGRMPFRRLIKELVRDSGNLSQVYREFGIKEEDVPS